MHRHQLLAYAWPVVTLGGLLAAACLASIWYINRLQADLGATLGSNAESLRAAQELQIRLRQLRFRSVVYAAEPSAGRRSELLEDVASVETALDAARRSCGAADRELLDVIEHGYRVYAASLPTRRQPAPPIRTLGELVQWSDERHVAALLVPCRELADRQDARMDLALKRSAAQTRWAGRGLLVLGLAGALAGVLSGFATARRLARAEHLAAVGHLAAGVAHEVRNPLTGIKLLVEAAVRPVFPTPLTPDDLHLIQQEILRMERTVQGLLHFARSPAPERMRHDLRDLIGEAVVIARGRAVLKSVTIRVEPHADPLPADVDRDQWLSLLTNLLINAIDAAPTTGEVGVGTATGPRGMIRVDVTDTGPGLDPDVVDRLFMPFVTTKFTGTGLGLTVAARVAKEHGGTLTAANRAQGGACFSVTVPAAETAHANAPRGG